MEMDIDASKSHGDFPDEDTQMDPAVGAVKDIPWHNEEVCPSQRVKESEMEQEQDENHETLAEHCCQKGKHFLNLEAEVSQDKDDDNNNGDMDDFITDDHDFKGWWINATYQSLAMQPIAQKNQDELQEAEKLANRFNKKARYQLSVKYSSTSLQNSIVSSWVIHCKPKKEHLVITYILGCQKQDLSIQALTYLRCQGDGYIYLDNAMPD
ncbi:hypothetical protein Moror_15801 [Moniliophthora roreri MCA 2997]|uniref:Spt5 transcription elongation factor N-terminal domain-containing protein n=1 Tax=Moniliophthora roreri (strain MCA 2997) TaxID=1381753 RepID=V2W3T7_MONRO|nr:hypothetical protein Moror_15801 [Moniliophthora roreri MCA 2997]